MPDRATLDGSALVRGMHPRRLSRSYRYCGPRNVCFFAKTHPTISSATNRGISPSRRRRCTREMTARDGRGPSRRRERHRRSENECPQSRSRQGSVSRSPSEAVTGQAVYIFSVRRVEEKKDNVSRPGMLDDGWHAAPRWLRRLEAETGSREGCDGKWFILPISFAWCTRYCGVPGILRRCCCR